MSVLRLVSLAVAPLALFFAGYAACQGPSDNQGAGGDADAGDAKPPDAKADAPPEAAGDADAAIPPWGTLPPWDPVWHETAPFAWAEVPHDALPDCGPGCTVLSAYEPHPFIPFFLDDKRLAYSTPIMNGTETFVLLVDLETLKEYLIDDGKSEPRLPDEDECEAGIPSMSGDSVAYEIICSSHTRVVLRSLITGERKDIALFGSYNDEGVPCRTGLTPTHAYWLYCPLNGPNSVSSFDLATGETKTTTAGVGICRTFWVRPGPKGDVVLCTNEGAERIVSVDIANDQASFVSPSTYAQNHGYVSPDGTEVVWVDSRDPGPNGEHGSYDSPFAGEIYWKNLVTGEERRLTFDSPLDPVKKAWPSVRNGVIVWEDWRALDPKNPTNEPGYYLLSAPARYLKDLDGSAQDLGPSILFYPQATDKGVVAMAPLGWQADAGWTDQRLVRYDWP